MNTNNEWMKCPGLEGNRLVFMLTLSSDVSIQGRQGQPLSVHLWAYCNPPSPWYNSLKWTPGVCHCHYRVFNKVFSRWQKCWSRWRRKKLMAWLASAESRSYQKFWNQGLLKWISSILEQKLECLKRTQTSLNFSFFVGNFQRKVGGELTWNSRQILPAGSYWEPWPVFSYLQWLVKNNSDDCTCMCDNGLMNKHF